MEGCEILRATDHMKKAKRLTASHVAERREHPLKISHKSLKQKRGSCFPWGIQSYQGIHCDSEQLTSKQLRKKYSNSGPLLTVGPNSLVAIAAPKHPAARSVENMWGCGYVAVLAVISEVSVAVKWREIGYKDYMDWKSMFLLCADI